MSYILLGIIPYLFVGGIIYLVIYLNGRKKHPNQPPFDWRRLGVGAAIVLILPCFISFTASAIFNELTSTSAFITMLVMAIIFLIIGFIVSHNTVIYGSLILGSIIEIVTAFAYNLDSISPTVMTIVAGLGLAVLIFIAYKKMQEEEVK